MRRRRKIFFWLAGSSGIIILLLLALNYLPPRLINSELLKGKIEDIISQRIGGEVAFKNIDLTIFPRPHATFRQGNISGEAANVSIDYISIYPKILPLLRGRLQGTKILVISPDINVSLSGHKKTEGKKPVTSESITDFFASLPLVYPGLVIVLEDGSINLIKEDNTVFELEEFDVRIDLPPAGLKVIKADMESSSLKLSARRDNKEMLVRASRLKGGLYYDKDKTSVYLSEIIFDSLDLKLSGELGIDNSSGLISLSVEGKELDVKSLREPVLAIAGDTPEVQKIFQIIKDGNIPSITLSSQASSFDDVFKAENIVINGSMSGGEIFVPKVGINLQGVNVDRFYYEKSGFRVEKLSGRAGKTSLTENPPHVSMDIFKDNDALRITNLTVRDEEYEAVLNLRHKKKVLEVSFTGGLSQTTLDKIFSEDVSSGGMVKGDIRARILLDRPLQSIFEGTIDGEDILFHWRPVGHVKIKTISLDAEGRNLKINSARLELRDKIFSLEGNVTASEEAVFFDVDVNTDGIEWDSIREAFEQDRDDKKTKDSWDVAYKGSIMFDPGYFTYDRFTLKPFKAGVSLEPDKIDIVVNDAALCGISIPGTLNMTSEELSVNLQPVAFNQEMDSVLDCFWGKSSHITGNLDIRGEFNAKGRGESLLKSLQGNLEFTAKDGMIQQHVLLSRLFALLNPSVIFNGELPDLAEEGFPYHTITAEVGFRENNLLIKELVIDGLSMKIAGNGSINLQDSEMDMDILVSPWKTPGKIIEKLPLIKEIVPGSIISIPIKVTGSYHDPQVMYFSPSMVGPRLLEIMENALTAPVKVIELLSPDENKE